MAFCTPTKSCSLWIEKIPRTGDRVRPRMGIPLVETVIGPSNRRRLWCIIKVAQILVPTCPAPVGRAWSNGNTDSALAKMNWPMRAAVGAIRGGTRRPRKRLCRLSGMPCRYSMMFPARSVSRTTQPSASLISPRSGGSVRDVARNRAAHASSERGLIGNSKHCRCKRVSKLQVPIDDQDLGLFRSSPLFSKDRWQSQCIAG
jgi:hypothetical protein